MEDRKQIDLRAALAVAICVVSWIVYLVVAERAIEHLPLWILVGIAVGAAGAVYGTWAWSPFRRIALTAAGITLGIFGVLALFTIGLPVFIAGALCIVAATRRPPELDD